MVSRVWAGNVSVRQRQFNSRHAGRCLGPACVLGCSIATASWIRLRRRTALPVREGSDEEMGVTDQVEATGMDEVGFGFAAHRCPRGAERHSARGAIPVRPAVRCLSAALLCACLSGPVQGKERMMFYTPERIAVARENAARYDWGKKEKRRILETGDAIRYYIGPTYTAADTFAAQSDDFLWLLQPTTELPRTYDLKTRALCPVHGAAVKKYSVWCPWNIDPINHPYQIQCMMGKEWYPSNKYHEGDMTSGDFPDDGSGCLYEGKRYYFLREYAHMVYGSVVVPTLRSLSRAYLLTGDRKYAHKGSVLLARLASQYPNYGWEDTSFDHLENRFARTYVGPWNNRHPYYTWKTGGMITDLIWSTFMLEAIALAYDAFYDVLVEDAELIRFLQAKGMPVSDGRALRGYIEDYVLRAGAVGILKGHIHGNEGFHQAAALAVALVLDDYSERHPNSKDLVDYAFHGGGRSAYMLINGLTRDGGGHESPNYSRIKFDFLRVAELMELVRRRRPAMFPEQRYPAIFAQPKARGLFDFHMDAMVGDNWWPSIGDCGGISAPRRVRDRDRRYSLVGKENLFAFREYGDPRYARACSKPDGTFLAGDLWRPYPGEEIREALQRPESAIHRSSRILDGYGLSVLESGEWPHARAVTLNYSSIIGHRQSDQLSLGVYARGVNLLPDLGYPRTWDYRSQWDAANLAHNTVTVNERSFTYPRFFRNAASLFASAGGVHVVTAHHNPYVEGTTLGQSEELPCDLYERTVVMVDVDPDRFYVVDVFAVNGGEQHDQSWHSMLVEPTVPDLDWIRQAGGTLAGPDVAEFAGYTDRWGRTHEKGAFPSFLTEIRRARLRRPAAWTWDSGLPEGDKLRLHILPVGGEAEVIMGKGRSPVWTEGKLDYLLVRRQVEGGGVSHFVSVLDAFQTTPTVQRVSLLSEDPIVLEVVREDGTDEVTIRIPPGPTRTTAHRPLGVRVRRGGAGEQREFRIGTLAEGDGPGYGFGRIVGLDHEPREIAVGLSADSSPADFSAGRHVRIFNAYRSALFRITASERVDGGVKLALDHTALMARFPVVGVKDGRLVLGTKSSFVTGGVSADGELTDGANDYYYGARLGEGAAAPVVRGIGNATPPMLYFMEPPEDEPGPRYAGTVVSLWHYGIGDAVETARVRSGSATHR